MNNFKLKHNSVSSLLNTEPVKLEDHVVKFPVYESMKPLGKVETPQSINFKEEPKLRPMPPVKEFDLEPKLVQRFVAPEKELIPFDTSEERNRIKYENQENRRMEEEARQRMMDQLKQVSQMERERPVLIPVQEGDSGINMIKRNSAAPFKLPHQSKAAPKQIVSSVGGSLVDNVKKTVSDYESQFDKPEFKEFVEKEKAAFGPGDEFGRMYAVVEPDGGYRLKDLSGEMEHIDIPEGMNYPESEKFLRDEARKNLQKRKGYFSDKAFMSNY